MKNTHYILIGIFFSGFVLPLTLFASEVRVETSRAYLNTGDEFLVNILLSVEDTLNAIEGEIVFDNDLVSIKEIREGNSSLNFWVEKPRVQDNKVYFSGVTPGGLRGANNFILSIVFEARKEGKTVIFPNNIIGLLHNGLGTQVTLDTSRAEVLIQKGDSNTYVEYVSDEDAPEFFNPTISQDQNIFDNQYFISFVTQDKGVGISYYEIKEYKIPFLKIFKPWKRIQSPYVLSDQNLTSHIEIRAVDYKNNKQTVQVFPQNKLALYVYVIYFSLISVLIFITWFLLFIKIKSRK